ncbi:Atlastin-1 [Aphelenchoides fujianensis]|nr:Atlastin-1 [Aphelenchoides fujianensis]
MGAWCVTKLRKNAEGMESLDHNRTPFLEALRSKEYADKPVCVIAIAGESRRGKSFFVNMILRYLQWLLKNPHVPVASADPHQWMLEQQLMFLSRDYGLDDDELGIKGWSGRMDDVLDIRNEDNAKVHDQIDGLFRSFAYCRLPYPGGAVRVENYDGNPEMMEPQFRDGLDQVIKFLRADLQPKCIDGKPVTCSQLAVHLEEWAKAFDSMDLPTPISLFQATINAKFQDESKKAFDKYKEAMEKKADGAEEWLDDVQERKQAFKRVRDVVVRAAAGEHEKHERLLATELDREFERLDAINRLRYEERKKADQERVDQHYNKVHTETIDAYRSEVLKSCNGDAVAFQTAHDRAFNEARSTFTHHHDATDEKRDKMTAHFEAELKTTYENLLSINEAKIKEREQEADQRALNFLTFAMLVLQMYH